MNEFDFMRGIPFGPYLSQDSLLRRLDPRTRILFVVVFMGALLLARQPASLAGGLCIILICWRIARVPFEPLRRGLVTALPLLVILAIIQILFRVGPDPDPFFETDFLTISWQDVWVGIEIVLRFSAFIALLGLAAASLSESEMTSGLQSLLDPLNRVGIPARDFVLAVQVSMRYFPLLAQSAERIAKAQASRGADWRPSGWNLVQRVRQIAPLIVPLFVNSLRRAEYMALAMDARGYGSLPRRTSLVELCFTPRDISVLLCAVTLGGLVAFPY